MVKQGIKIFCRLKPTKAKTGLYGINNEEETPHLLSFIVPKDLAAGFINNKKEEYKFQFEKVFDRNAKQDEVFNCVAKDVIDNVLAGYNGTIFAYGQTGSGKTFSITGGAERYVDRGIIPRTLSYIFEQYGKNPDYVITTHVSYLEIYCESGYDLLDPKHEATKLEDLPKVSLMEDTDGNIHLKNLTIHPAASEEEALNLLFLGDTNRMIAETPMNQASTRSHCIFTVHVSVRETGSATLRRSKLHLVDLAGSERIGKTGVGGTLLTEAKSINLSLHYLEFVIVALSDKSRQHIPYRNSMMTSILRDSLGGNCMTSMIATCSVEKKNIDESISTCRFAQRVAMIKNDAIINEEMDPKLVIIRLKGEIQELKNQLALASGDQSTDPLSKEDLDGLNEAVAKYLEDPDPDCILNVGADMRKINEAFRILKKHCKGRVAKTVTPGPSVSPSKVEATPQREDGGECGESYLSSLSSLPRDAEIKKLRELIQQRDNEINILVNMLKKEKKRVQDALNQSKDNNRIISSSSELHHVGSSQSASSYNYGSPPYEIRSEQRVGNQESDMSLGRSFESQSSLASSQSLSDMDNKLSGTQKLKNQRKLLGEMSVGRQEAFEIFKRDYLQNESIEQNKQDLKTRYGEAKSLGLVVNESRQIINKVKGQIQHRRLQRAMSGEGRSEGPDEVEQELRGEMEHQKTRYKEAFGELKTLKTEIEHLQHLLEKSRLQMQKDFEIWWAEQSANLSTNKLHEKSPRPPSNPGKAWRTPPLSPVKNHHTDENMNSKHFRDDNNHRKHSRHGSHRHSHSAGAENPESHTHADHNESSRSKGKHRQYSARSRNALVAALSGESRDLRKPPIPPLALNDGSISKPNGNMDKERHHHTQMQSSQSSHSNLRLTGDKGVDEDIMAFIQARQNLLQR